MTNKKLLRAVEGKHHDRKPRYSRKRQDGDVEAAAEAIELVDAHASEDYARAAIRELEDRGWRRSR